MGPMIDVPGSSNIMTLVGFMGGTLLALSGLPQAYKSIKEGRTGDISRALLWMWVIGELEMFIFTIFTAPDSIPLLMNFGANFVLVGITTWYYYFPRKQHRKPKWSLQKRRGRVKRVASVFSSRP